MKSYHVIGLMSGTSMDGVDLAYCHFEKVHDQWKFNIIHCLSKPFTSTILKQLSISKDLTASELFKLDKEIGLYFAEAVNEFIQEFNIQRREIDAIASHGHTVYHQPQNGFTVQIGCGETLAYSTGLPVIDNFRQKDVVAGGQGAPLVPIGDKLLFFTYADAFLNIGGFTNITFLSSPVIAFDISPGNLPLNMFATDLGLTYDPEGSHSRSGNIDKSALYKLNALPFYSSTPPKSLGTEWLETQFLPLFESVANAESKLRTCVEHISDQISLVINTYAPQKVMITGGGAFNTFLIDTIRSKSKAELILPSTELIGFKEAVVFAFLGVLFLENTCNTIPSVTGASKATVGGMLHKP